jgi:hypothetical protein
MRNIANHKIIIKYSHSCNKLSQMLVKLRKGEKNKMRQLSQGKLVKKTKIEPLGSDNKNKERNTKLTRPKTTKPSAKLVLTSKAAAQNHKIY